MSLPAEVKLSASGEVCLWPERRFWSGGRRLILHRWSRRIVGRCRLSDQKPRCRARLRPGGRRLPSRPQGSCWALIELPCLPVRPPTGD